MFICEFSEEVTLRRGGRVEGHFFWVSGSSQASNRDPGECFMRGDTTILLGGDSLPSNRSGEETPGENLGGRSIARGKATRTGFTSGSA